MVTRDVDPSRGRAAFRPHLHGLTSTLMVALLGAAGSLDCTMGDSGSIHFSSSAAKRAKKDPIPCAGDGHCPPPTPYCDPVSATCIQCIGDANCGGPKRFCGPGGQCVECLDQSGCEKAKPYCDLARLVCVECEGDANCGVGRVCDGFSRRCVASCADSRECEPMRPYCDLARRLCVQCLAPTNCIDPKKPVCSAVSGDCAECTSPAHCGAERPFCNPLTFKCEG